MYAHIQRVYLSIERFLKPGDFVIVDAPKLGWKKVDAGIRGAGWSMTTQALYLYLGITSPNLLN